MVYNNFINKNNKTIFKLMNNMMELMIMMSALLDHVVRFPRHMTCARENRVLYTLTRPNFNYEPVSAASVHRQGH